MTITIEKMVYCPGKFLYKVISTSLIALEPLIVITNVEGPEFTLKAKSRKPVPEGNNPTPFISPSSLFNTASVFILSMASW